MNTTDIIAIIKEVLAKMNVAVTSVDVGEQGGLVMFNIVTPDSGMLIGKEGEHLKAFNYILGHIISKKAQNSMHVHIDVNGYKQAANNSIIAEARKVADEVLHTKKSIDLRPMGAYERRIIHNLFSDNINITTKSAGDDENRHIVVAYSEI